MCAHDAIEMRRQLKGFGKLGIIINEVLDAKDRRIDELLASNQQLRERAQRAEASASRWASTKLGG